MVSDVCRVSRLDLTMRPTYPDGLAVRWHARYAIVEGEELRAVSAGRRV